ncbi:MAG: FAD-dependent thymidylate synthase [bacterium]
MYAEIEVVGISLPIKIGDDGLLVIDAELGIDGIIADAGRTCYQKFPADEETLSLQEKNKRLVTRLVKMGHLSVLEHASITVRIRGGSRAMTHQLVRHRHVAISQESQRYCDEGDFGYVVPPSIEEAGMVDKYTEAMAICHQLYLGIQEDLKAAKAKGILSSDRKVNEDARFILPNAVQSEIVLTANVAEWRWIFFRRLTTHAQWEIKDICLLCLVQFMSLTCAFNDMWDYYNENGSMDGFAFTAG